MHTEMTTSEQPACIPMGGLLDLADRGELNPEALNWDHLDAVTAAGTTLLNSLAEDHDRLTELAYHVPRDPHLAGLCEHYDILDKIVLHDDPSGWRLRLHVFLPGYFDRPHNHRWTYTSRILTGSYLHTLYGSDAQLPVGVADDAGTVDVSRLAPHLIRTETAGATYTLHHCMIHSVTAAPFTTSLIVRGPAVKNRFLVTDRTTGQSWWQYGAATETPEQAAQKRMTPQQLADRLAQLTDDGILGEGTISLLPCRDSASR